MPNTINSNSKVPGTQTGQEKSRLKNTYLSYAKHNRKGLKQKCASLRYPEEREVQQGKRAQVILDVIKGIK